MKRFLPGIRCLVPGMVLLVLQGCVTQQRNSERPIPRFGGSTPAPVAIRVEDKRPDLGNLIQRERDEWLYYRQDRDAQPLEMAQMVGNALNMFGATAGYRIVKTDTPVEMWKYLLHIEYGAGYARWPVRVDRNATQVQVDGACEIRYVLYRRGKVFKSGRLESRPKPFSLPLNILHRDNVEKMVSESLAHQFNLARRNVLDELMVELAETWPKYVKSRN